MYLAPGTVLAGDLVVGGVLGDGGHGTVYYARRQHVELALKVLRFPHPDAVRRLVQEGDILERLRHPHIVPLVDVLDLDGHPALLSLFAPAGSLAALLREGVPPLAEALALFRKIVAGVAHAHANRVLHRDLKPANILLKRDDRGLVPWVADFGVARLLDAEGHTAEPVGTRGYMAPEQIETPTDLDARVDVFALGCILHELTHGAPAFGAAPAARTFAANAPTLDPPGLLAAELPASVVETIRACLEPRRERRIADCGGILAMLDGGAGSMLRGVARAPRTLAQAGNSARKLWFVAAVVGVAGAALPSPGPQGVGAEPAATTGATAAPAIDPGCPLLSLLGLDDVSFDAACFAAGSRTELAVVGEAAAGACLDLQAAIAETDAIPVLEDGATGLERTWDWNGAALSLRCDRETAELTLTSQPLHVPTPDAPDVPDTALMAPPG